MTRDTWDGRLRTTLVVLQWLALVIGIVVSVTEEASDASIYVAGGLASIWVIGASVIPLEVTQRPFVLDAMTLAGVALTMTALLMTGGFSSPYLLLALTPSIYAGMFGGVRPGLSVGALTALLAMTIALANNTDLAGAAPLATLSVSLGLAVAQIRKIFLELNERVSAAEASTDASSQRLEHLESANQLLASLAEITSRDEINPISVGRAALEAITSRFPSSAGTAALEGENGPILVSKYGIIPDPAFETDIPLKVGDKRVGFIRLSTIEPLDATTVEGLQEAVRPVALAFANALLLQDVTRNAVREERVRLARELHDEIGPSLASLGLSLDMALIQGVDQRQINDHLNTLRGRVTDLVEEVRSTVTDLRVGRTPSLVTRLEDLSSELPEYPPVKVMIDERRPVRPSLAENIYGIVGEAVRNAVEHSKSDVVRISGWIDFDRGRVVVADEGVGFDTALQPAGHFGLVGMHERATASGLRLQISSRTGLATDMPGTTVEIEWGDT